MSIEGLQAKLRVFARERDWEQFHIPKNLVMALGGAVAELTELFQWLTPEQSSRVMLNESDAEHVRDEVADVLAYLLRLADVLGVDLEAALNAKMIKNAHKYPVEGARGTAWNRADFD